MVAELTKLEAKLGEVTGLAMAAQAVTKKVMQLAKADGETDLVGELQRMHDEAAETERRCSELAASFNGKKTAVLEEARATKAKGAKMMATYLDKDAETLDGFEFMTMAEAGEVGHWTVLQTLNRTARHREIAALVSWALPIQQGHLKGAMAGSQQLAAQENPSDPA
jgi:hypothetical protein